MERLQLYCVEIAKVLPRKGLAAKSFFIFPDLDGPKKPIVLGFSKILICFRCGFAEFQVPDGPMKKLHRAKGPATVGLPTIDLAHVGASNVICVPLTVPTKNVVGRKKDGRLRSHSEEASKVCSVRSSSARESLPYGSTCSTNARFSESSNRGVGFSFMS